MVNGAVATVDRVNDGDVVELILLPAAAAATVARVAAGADERHLATNAAPTRDATARGPHHPPQTVSYTHRRLPQTRKG